MNNKQTPKIVAATCGYDTPECMIEQLRARLPEVFDNIHAYLYGGDDALWGIVISDDEHLSPEQIKKAVYDSFE